MVRMASSSFSSGGRLMKSRATVSNRSSGTGSGFRGPVFVSLALSA
jgi:hypothetical protein